jgi:hypothetical protein
MSGDAKYNDDEVRAIIDRALRSEPSRDVSHEELLAIASEVGISREAIERAARDVEDGREASEAKTRVLAKRRKRFASHLWTFAVVNLFLFAINFLTTPGEWWVLFPLLGWGLAMLFHARAALSKEVSERAIRRERKRMDARRSPQELARRRAEHARLSSKNLESAASEFGSAVQDRVGQLLSKAAAELRNGAARPGARIRVEAPSSGADSHVRRGFEDELGDTDEPRAGARRRTEY